VRSRHSIEAIITYFHNAAVIRLFAHKYCRTKCVFVEAFSLIAAMTEGADDFMAGRFREVVWPCIGKMIRSFAEVRRQDIRTPVPSSSSLH
jgi:hypothetical protein